MSRLSAAMACVAVCLAWGLPAWSAPAAPQTQAARTPARIAASRPLPNPSAAEARFAALANEERARLGLRPLAWDATLQEAARRHSEEMARLDYFDHRSPVRGHETPADRWELVATRVPDEYAIAENLFFGSVADAAWGHRSLMESEGHRRNIVNPAYTAIGVGVHIDRTGQMWATQMFTTEAAIPE